MKDELGDRMKMFYEDRTKQFLTQFNISNICIGLFKYNSKCGWTVYDWIQYDINN